MVKNSEATGFHPGSTNSKAPRQGVVVHTKLGSERHLHVNGTTFRIPERYNHLEVVGKGSYGVVCSAIDSVRHIPVAIKKIAPMAAHSVDAKHVLREVRVMRHLGQHDNIVTLEDLFCNEVEDELYIVMELLESDLHRIIQSQQVLSMKHHRVFMLQILRGVEFLHKNGIIHRDLKPGNILVSGRCEVRISDFGLARERPKGLNTRPENPEDEGMTEHVVTRWYRPPELMLSPNGFYGFSVDMWSVGCIFGELLGRRPLFPGSSFVDQLSLIFDVIGAPIPEEVVHIRGAQARKFLDKLNGKAGVAFSDLLPGAPGDAASLLRSLLLFDPQKRCTPSEGLRHAFFGDLRKEPVPVVDPPTGLRFEFEEQGMPRSTLKNLIALEVKHFQSGANLKVHSRRTSRALDVSGRAPVSAVARAAARSVAAFSTGETRDAADRCYSDSTPPSGGDAADEGRKLPEPPGQQQLQQLQQQKKHHQQQQQKEQQQQRQQKEKRQQQYQEEKRKKQQKQEEEQQRQQQKRQQQQQEQQQQEQEKQRQLQMQQQQQTQMEQRQRKQQQLLQQERENKEQQSHNRFSSYSGFPGSKDDDDISHLDAASLQSSRLCPIEGEDDEDEDEEVGGTGTSSYEDGGGVHAAGVVLADGFGDDDDGDDYAVVPVLPSPLSLSSLLSSSPSVSLSSSTLSLLSPVKEELERCQELEEKKEEARREGENKAASARGHGTGDGNGREKGCLDTAKEEGEVKVGERGTSKPTGRRVSLTLDGTWSPVHTMGSAQDSVGSRALTDGPPNTPPGWGERAEKAEGDGSNKPPIALEFEENARGNGLVPNGSVNRFRHSPGPSLSDTSSSVQTFVSLLPVPAAPATPQRRSSLAGFARGSESWEGEDRCKGLDARGNVIAGVRSPGALSELLLARNVSRVPTEIERGDKDDGEDWNNLDSADAFGGKRRREQKESQPSAATIFASGVLRRERAERAWRVVGVAGARVKAKADAAAAATKAAAAGPPGGTGRRVPPPRGHTTRSARDAGGRVASRIRPHLSPARDRAPQRAPVVSSMFLPEAERGQFARRKSGGAVVTGRDGEKDQLTVRQAMPEAEGRHRNAVHGSVYTKTVVPESTTADPRWLPAVNTEWSARARGAASAAIGTEGVSAAEVAKPRDKATFAPLREVARTGGESDAKSGQGNGKDNTKGFGGDQDCLSLRTPIASVYTDNLQDSFAPATRRIELHIAATGGSASVVSSRGSPPPVPPPLGRFWDSDRRARRHELAKARAPTEHDTAGLSVLGTRPGERSAAHKLTVSMRGQGGAWRLPAPLDPAEAPREPLSPSSPRFAVMAQASTTKGGLPPRSERFAAAAAAAAVGRARGRGRQRKPLPPPTKTGEESAAPSRLSDSSNGHVSVSELGGSHQFPAAHTAVAPLSGGDSNGGRVSAVGSDINLQPPPVPTGVTISTQTSFVEHEIAVTRLPTPPEDLAGVRSPSKLTVSKEGWNWAKDQVPPVEAATPVEAEVTVAATAATVVAATATATATAKTESRSSRALAATTKTPLEGTRSMPLKPLAPTEARTMIDDNDVADDLVRPGDGTMSLASAMYAIDEREGALAEANRAAAYQLIPKPWGFPLELETATRSEDTAKGASTVGGGKDATADELSSAASVEQKFNLLKRLWRRSSAGKRAGEQGALSTLATGPSSFAGPEKRPVSEKAAKETPEAGRVDDEDAVTRPAVTPVAETAPKHTPDEGGGDNKEATTRPMLIVRDEPRVPLPKKMDIKFAPLQKPLTPRRKSHNRTQSSVTSSTSPASSAASGNRAYATTLNFAGIRASPAHFHKGSVPALPTTRVPASTSGAEAAAVAAASAAVRASADPRGARSPVWRRDARAAPLSRVLPSLRAEFSGKLNGADGIAINPDDNLWAATQSVVDPKKRAPVATMAAAEAAAARGGGIAPAFGRKIEDMPSHGGGGMSGTREKKKLYGGGFGVVGGAGGIGGREQRKTPHQNVTQASLTTAAKPPHQGNALFS